MKNNKYGYLLNSVITVSLMLFFGFFPAPAPITPMGMKILGIVLGAIYGWSMVDTVWPSIVALVLLGFSGYTTVKQAFALAVSNDTVLFVFFLLLLSGIMNQAGVAKAIALRIISWKRAEGKPWLITLLVFLSAYVPAMAVGGLPIMLICWSIVYQISNEVGFKPQDEWPSLMLFGVAIASTIGMCFFPFQITPIGMYAILEAVDPAKKVAYLPYMIYSGTFSVLMLLGFYGFMRFIARPSVSQLENYKVQGEREPFSFEQKLSLGAMLAVIILLSIPSIFPGLTLSHLLSKIGNTGIVALVVGACLVFRKDGKQVFSIDAIASKGLIWGMLFMFSTALCISTALTSKETGISQFLINKLSVVFSGMSPFVFQASMLLLVLIAANFLSHPVVAVIFIPIAYNFGKQIGVDILVIMPSMIFLNLLDFMLPSASPAAAILYGNRKWITTRSILKYSAVMMLLAYLIVVVVGVPLSTRLFG